jgi:alpha-L-rhamnosidase
MKAIHLQVNHLDHPMGIPLGKIYLSWQCENGIEQTAYQVIIRCGENLVWDSRKVNSSLMHAEYDGHNLHEREIYTYDIKLWKNEKEEVSSGTFETGLREDAPWPAEWITGDYKVNPKRRYPVDCFIKEFQVQKPVKARLYITSCGIYRAYLNGKRVGVDYLTPGHTDYNKRLYYQTYDILPNLQEGTNRLEVNLADGWYRGSCGAWGRKNQYGTETKLLAMLYLTYEDHDEVIGTDGTWFWDNDGPIRFADNKDGEIIDENLSPQYRRHAKVTQFSVIPKGMDHPTIHAHETFTPKVLVTPDQHIVWDFGQNIAGILHFQVSAHKGQHIYLRFGEMLDDEGNFTQKNIQCTNKKITTPLQEVHIKCREGMNEYETCFAIFGFRYVQVMSDTEINPCNVKAIALYTDVQEAGNFNSSNTLLNRFFENTKWSLKGNMADVLTDCPTRERHGWTGDAQIFFESACYLFEFETFGRKFLNDMYDWQKKNGCLPQIAPHGGVDPYMSPMDGSVGWSDAGIIIPWRCYELYRDKDILQKYYEGMKKYAWFMMKRCGKTGLFAKKIHLDKENKKYVVNSGQSYGEWAEPQDVQVTTWKDFVAPHPEVSTAYTAYMMKLMMKTAEVLGRVEDVKLYQKYYEGCKKAYQAMSDTSRFSLDTDRQARLVRPLAFDLLNEKQKAYASQRLIEALDRYKWRVGTGFLSTPLILDVLTEIDIKYAYKLLENEEMPGWLFMAKNGATTVWESWEGTKAQGSVASLNHYSKGAIVAWLFKTCAGIQVNGENSFLIHPQPGGTLTQACGEWKSPFGCVRSEWKKEGNYIRYEIEIPSNCSADVKIGNKTVSVKSGKYNFTQEAAEN